MKSAIDIIRDLSKIRLEEAAAVEEAKRREEQEKQREKDEIMWARNRKLAPVYALVSELAEAYPANFNHVTQLDPDGHFIFRIPSNRNPQTYYITVRIRISPLAPLGEGNIEIYHGDNSYATPVLSAPDWATLQPYFMAFAASVAVRQLPPDPIGWKGLTVGENVLYTEWKNARDKAHLAALRDTK